MSLPAFALCTLAELKDELPGTGSSRDDALERAIRAASRLIERNLRRRVIYRAPAETADIVAAVTFANGSLTIANQPNSAGRTLSVTVTGAPTAGIVTATGTVAGTAGVTEAFDVTNGFVQHGLKFFTALSGIAVTAKAGGTTPTVQVQSSVGYVEYHTPDGSPDLYALEWPVAQLLSAYEDSERTYAAADLLTASSDYLLNGPTGRIVRVSSATTGRKNWGAGFRAVKLTYSGGYSAGNLPADLRDVALELAIALYEERAKGRVGISGETNDMGAFTRFGPSGISKLMGEKLAPYRRLWPTTGERDFDLEAA